MINYSAEKTRYKVNALGSLYIDNAKLSNNEQPIIYIGGQCEHRGHLIEKSGLTSDLNHNLYTGSWMYEYPIGFGDKSSVNAKNFSENLLASLKEANLRDVILLTHSHGGLVGAYASKSDLVDRVISVHPPILGTPLANPDYLAKYRQLLTKSQKLMLSMMKFIINYDYGFQHDNYNGVDLRNVDLNKLLVVGNYLDVNSDKNRIMVETYHIIENILNVRNDGIVIFEPEEFEKIGINYSQMPENKNHINSANPDYFKDVLSRVLSK